MKWTWFLAVLAAVEASAAQPVILVEGKVAQYRIAAFAAQRFLPGALEVDPGAANAGAKLATASVILAVGQRSFGVAREKAPGTPTVFCMLLGAKPAMLAGNVTGVPLESDPRSLLTRLQALHPGARRVGVVYNPDASELLILEAQRAATALGIKLLAQPVKEASGVKDAVAKMVGSIDILWLPPDPRLFSRELFAYLLSFSAERRLPLVGFLESFTQAGALASVSADYQDIGERAGRLAAEAASRGSVQRPPSGVVFSPGVLSINLKTARALGVEVSPRALAEAKNVIR